jgi:hypothetical protein
MPVGDFLEEVYYIDEDAGGSDYSLWDNLFSASNPANIKGYYPRIKKLNDTLLPINEQLSGKKVDLVQYKSQEKVEKATYDSALSGIETTREDFKALAGVYPEEAQTNNLSKVKIVSATTQDGWYTIPEVSFDTGEKDADGNPITGTKQDINALSANQIEVNIRVKNTDVPVYPTPLISQGIERIELATPY